MISDSLVNVFIFQNHLQGEVTESNSTHKGSLFTVPIPTLVPPTSVGVLGTEKEQVLDTDLF
jgi:hypothetical protein